MLALVSSHSEWENANKASGRFLSRFPTYLWITCGTSPGDTPRLGLAFKSFCPECNDCEMPHYALRFLFAKQCTVTPSYSHGGNLGRFMFVLVVNTCGTPLCAVNCFAPSGRRVRQPHVAQIQVLAAACLDRVLLRLLHGASSYYRVLWFTLTLIYSNCFVKRARRRFALQTYMHCSWVYYKKQTNKNITDWILKWFRAALAFGPNFFPDAHQKNSLSQLHASASDSNATRNSSHIFTFSKIDHAPSSKSDGYESNTFSRS